MKLGLGLRVGKNNINSGTSYGTQLTSILTYGDGEGYTRPSDTYLSLIDTAITSLVSNGIWSKLDYLYFHFLGNQYGKVNLVDPGTFNATEVGTPVWTIGEGFDTNSALNGLNTNWIPSTNAVNYTQNSASLFQWHFTAISEDSVNQYGCGVEVGSLLKANIRFLNSGNSVITSHMNSGTQAQLTKNLNAGLKHSIRTDASTIKIYHNTTLLGQNASSTSTGLPTLAMHLGFNNDDSVAKEQFNGTLSISGAGANLESDNTNLYNVLNTLISSL